MVIKTNDKLSLKYLIENECFHTCPLLAVRDFISYCTDRGIRITKEQLEQYEKLGILYPIARIKRPKIKIKVEYVDNGKKYRTLGVIKEGEKWDGDTIEDYSTFYFENEFTHNWLKEGFLWDPSTKPFQSWDTFADEKVESFYSIFQCYTIYNLIRKTTLEIGAERWISYTNEEIDEIISRISKEVERRITYHQQKGIRGDEISIICQIISNRYFPETQSDRRTFQLATSVFNRNWDWDEYCRKWNPTNILADLGLSSENLKKLQRLISADAKYVDPLEMWYGLVSFVSLSRKKKLKGNALYAQTLYSMERMVRKFYEDLTNEKLPSPDESDNWNKDDFYGKGVTQNELQYLEFLTNEYHLNPKPKLILIVEGDGEEAQFPFLVEKLFGYSFPKIGIMLENIRGVGNFTGIKRIDKYGALEYFIDAYHDHQTIIFVILDNEGRVDQIKQKLIKKRSRFYPNRTVTKDEYIHIWNKNIEFDNFNHNEIAKTLSEICEKKYQFQEKEIKECEDQFSPKEENPLNKLYKEKVGIDIPKTMFLKKLFDIIISNPQNEFDNNKIPKRPVVQVLLKIIELATINYQPFSQKLWLINQESGYFGDIIK